MVARAAKFRFGKLSLLNCSCTIDELALWVVALGTKRPFKASSPIVIE